MKVYLDGEVLRGFGTFTATYFSSPARQMWAWPKYDIINRLSLKKY